MIAFGLDLRAALGLNSRQFELFREDLRKLVHGEIHFKDVAARSIAGLTRAVLIHIAGSQRLTGLALALSDAASVAAAEAEVRHFDLRDRNADKVLSLFTDQLALRNVFLQVLLAAAPDALPKAEIVLFYIENHCFNPRDLCIPRLVLPRIA